MFCNKCGKELPDDAEFCIECGIRIVRREAGKAQIKAVKKARIKAPAETSKETPVKSAESMEPGLKKKSNGAKWWIFGGASVALAVAAVLLVVILGGKGILPAGLGDIAEKMTAGIGNTQTDGSGGMANLSLRFQEVIYKEGLPDARVFLTSGYDNPEGEIVAEFTTQPDGTVQTELEAGEYTLCWEAEGYYSGHDNLTVNGAEMSVVKHMLPVLTEQKAYILIEWDSDRDLDLCVFNAQTNQYINIMSAIDDTGDFLYYDNNGTDGYELIYLNDYTAGVYTVYVCDAESLLQETGSVMEAEGLTVSIYTADGLLYQEKADTAETAALWSPVYLYQGEAIELKDYIYDMTDYAWAVRDKNDESYARNEEAMEVYGAFLRGEYATEDGKYLTDLLPEYAEWDLWNGYVDEITYAYLDLGADNVQELWVAFVGMDHYCPNDGTTSEYILKYDGTALKVCYECGFYGRYGSTVSYYGVVNGGGSSGATSGGFYQTILDADGNAVEIYSAEYEDDVIEYYSYLQPFWDDGVNVREAWEKSGLGDYYLGLSFYEIADSYYIVYEDSMNEVSYQDVANVLEDLGYQLYTDAQIGEIITDYIRQMGFEELPKDGTELVEQTLDTQYYAEYIKPETLTLTTEEIDELMDIAYAIYWCSSDEGDLSSWEIKQDIETRMQRFIFMMYDYGGEGEYLGDDGFYGYYQYQVDAEEFNDMLYELLGMEYDLTTLTKAMDSDFGAYYENGNIITYIGRIGSFMVYPYYDGMYVEDELYEEVWKFKVVECSELGDGETGYIELWLRPVNNSYGYEITGCTVDYYW